MIFEESLKPFILKSIQNSGLKTVEPEWSAPKQPEHGDVATNVAFLLAKEAGKPPRVVAQMLLENMEGLPDWIIKAEVAGAGYINFHIQPHAYFEALKIILKEGEKFGESFVGGGKNVLLEFVSANPTGPLNIVSARAAAVGDALASLLKTVGYKPKREFYVNDVGNQIELFARSIEARLLEARGEEGVIPPEGYQGEYLKTFAETLADTKKKYSLEQLKTLGLKYMIAWQKKSLENFGVTFDKWFSQKELIEKGMIEKALKKLEKGGHLYEKEGALFFSSIPFGDDKDRVVKKQDGEYSYFASDIAYHGDKFARGFDWAIDLLGPDHHGYVARTKAAVAAFGFNPDQLTVLIIQQVNLMEGEVLVKMSKRAGKMITMDDLLGEVGRDVARYFFLQRSASSPLDFDLELAKKETSENPVFYIQYAFARISSIFAKALEQKIKPDFKNVDLTLLDLPEEKMLARQLLSFPDMLARAAKELSVHLVAFYCLELARQFQSYYSQAKHDTRYRVVDMENPARTMAKLYLLKNIGIVLQNALRILGISAPERMESKDVAGAL
ncbi:MAG: arginine--tRNA ligase, partial [Deltaproteobacteria bacterium]|nr:arginine--tRNA ligase [Deltaproteobacteria bacterium]